MGFFDNQQQSAPSAFNFAGMGSNPMIAQLLAALSGGGLGGMPGTGVGGNMQRPFPLGAPQFPSPAGGGNNFNLANVPQVPGAGGGSGIPGGATSMPSGGIGPLLLGIASNPQMMEMIKGMFAGGGFSNSNPAAGTADFSAGPGGKLPPMASAY